MLVLHDHEEFNTSQLDQQSGLNPSYLLFFIYNANIIKTSITDSCIIMEHIMSHEHCGIWKHQQPASLLKSLFRQTSSTSHIYLSVCAGESTGDYFCFPSQRASNAESVSMSQHHHDTKLDINGLVQDCSNSSALAMELLQSCTKP